MQDPGEGGGGQPRIWVPNSHNVVVGVVVGAVASQQDGSGGFGINQRLPVCCCDNARLFVFVQPYK